jgi:hypothetical protein
MEDIPMKKIRIDLIEQIEKRAELLITDIQEAHKSSGPVIEIILRDILADAVAVNGKINNLSYALNLKE